MWQGEEPAGWGGSNCKGPRREWAWLRTGDMGEPVRPACGAGRRAPQQVIRSLQKLMEASMALARVGSCWLQEQVAPRTQRSNVIKVCF